MKFIIQINITKKAQGSFEYMSNYGWAVLILIILGIVLYSLGVFNPSTPASASGFRYLNPVSWSFTGGNMHMSNVTIAFENLIGRNVIFWINDTTDYESIIFSNKLGNKCFLNSSLGEIRVWDSAGNTIEIQGTKATFSASGVVTIQGVIGDNVSSECGGVKQSPYRYYITFKTMDDLGVLRIDTGSVNGRYI
ncbi:MAG: hypothetical protein QW076_05295 [Candidatus Anstonellales archaeon]